MTEQTENLDKLNNIALVQYLNRLILKEAYKTITEGLVCDNKIAPGKTKAPKPYGQGYKNATLEERLRIAERMLAENKHARMWGKDTLLAVFDRIANTELKIEKQRGNPPTEEPTYIMLDEKDIALVEHYLERQSEEAAHVHEGEILPPLPEGAP